MIFLSLVYFKSNTISYQNISFNTQSADITKPKFSINGSNQKISVTANSGNFINADEIMLTNNVIFKSNKFKIYGDNVIFNKNNLVATSKEKSKFIVGSSLLRTSMSNLFSMFFFFKRSNKSPKTALQFA